MPFTEKFGVGLGIGFVVKNFDPMDFPVRFFVKMNAIHDGADALRSQWKFDRLFAKQVNGP